MDERKDFAGAVGSEGKHYAIVGGLLVLIILLLSALWLRERRARVRAQRDLATLREDAAGRLQLQAAMGRMIRGGAAADRRPLPREDLPRETVRWNGQTREVLRVSAAAGRRIGLRPGDAVVVSADPASAPAATAPAATAPVR